MFDQLKWYFVNIGLKKYAPVGAMAALAALGTFMAAHAGMLEQYGVTYGDWLILSKMPTQPSGPCLLIEMDTLSKAAIAGVFALVAMMTRATEHHVATAIKPPVEGGQRSTDPPAATPPQGA